MRLLEHAVFISYIYIYIYLSILYYIHILMCPFYGPSPSSPHTYSHPAYALAAATHSFVPTRVFTIIYCRVAATVNYNTIIITIALIVIIIIMRIFGYAAASVTRLLNYQLSYGHAGERRVRVHNIL